MKELFTKYIWNNDHTARYTCRITYDRQIYTGSVMFEKVEYRNGYCVTTHDVFQDFFWKRVLDVLPPNKRHSKKKGEEMIERFIEVLRNDEYEEIAAGLAEVE